jgi:hypothetical protein
MVDASLTIYELRATPRPRRAFTRQAFLALALVFVLVWFGAFVLFHVAGALVKVLLVAALILSIIHFVAVDKRPRAV